MRSVDQLFKRSMTAPEVFPLLTLRGTSEVWYDTLQFREILKKVVKLACNKIQQWKIILFFLSSNFVCIFVCFCPLWLTAWSMIDIVPYFDVIKSDYKHINMYIKRVRRNAFHFLPSTSSKNKQISNHDKWHVNYYLFAMNFVWILFFLLLSKALPELEW